jgi:uncharacterized protein YjbJ (UPF0337 family)
MKKKISAETNKAVGMVKEKAGKLVGNDRLEREGKAEQVKGHVQNAVAGAKGAVRAALKK